MDREFFRAILGLIVVFALVIFCLHACSDANAKDTAKTRLGPDAECVSSSDDLAYCTYRGVGYICDKSNCIKAPSAPHTLLELDGDRQRKEDEQTVITTTPAPTP